MATPDYSGQLTRAYTFYRGLPDCDAFAILKNRTVRTVFYGFDEKLAGDAVFRYPFLSKSGEYGGTYLFVVNSSAPTGCAKI
jgi:hypothetical protein